MISRDPTMCGGDVHITGTRKPVWVVVRNRELGMSLEESAQDLGLTIEQVAAALVHVAHHQAEVDARLAGFRAWMGAT